MYEVRWTMINGEDRVDKFTNAHCELAWDWYFLLSNYAQRATDSASIKHIDKDGSERDLASWSR